MDRPKLTSSERIRYERHLTLSDVGEQGQARLKEARILMVGLGGLGSSAAQYLAAAGVGTLGLVDFDTVSLSNLQRQVVYETADVGRPKVECARIRLEKINPDIRVVGFEKKIAPENALEIFSNFDLVLDGTDNFSSRYIINDACAKLGLPNISASLSKFEGQLSTFIPPNGPCYRCLFPEPPTTRQQNCAEAGVLGVLPGVVGVLQATEALKLALQIGTPLVGKLLVFNALDMAFHTVAFPRRQDCLSCGPNANFPALGITESFEVEDMLSISPQDLKAQIDRGEEWTLLDVREPLERSVVHIGGLFIPMQQLPARYTEIDPSQNIAVYCHHGVRSQHAAEFLRSVGIQKAFSVSGGIDRWAVEISPDLIRY